MDTAIRKLRFEGVLKQALLSPLASVRRVSPGGCQIRRKFQGSQYLGEAPALHRPPLSQDQSDA